MICPHCGKPISGADAAAVMGSVSSDAKAAAARENGKKGGRPPGSGKRKPNPSTTREN